MAETKSSALSGAAFTFAFIVVFIELFYGVFFAHQVCTCRDRSSPHS